MVQYFKRLGRLEPSKVCEYGRTHLWPVFIFSARRAKSAHLNWAAQHVLSASSFAPLIIVLNPNEETQYRDTWPDAIFCTVLQASAPGELCGALGRLGYLCAGGATSYEAMFPLFVDCRGAEQNVSAMSAEAIGSWSEQSRQ